MQESSHNSTENPQNLPSSESFKKVFKPYLVKWSIAYTILICLVTVISVFLMIPNLEFSQWLVSLFMDIGTVFINRGTSYGAFAISMNALGIIVTGINVAGVFAVGINTCGIVAVGMNTVGFVAIGANPVGVVAVGYNACGIYTLTYSEQWTGGKYVFAPHRQDPKAVAFFTRWLPRLSESGFTA